MQKQHPVKKVDNSIARTRGLPSRSRRIKKYSFSERKVHIPPMPSQQVSRPNRPSRADGRLKFLVSVKRLNLREGEKGFSCDVTCQVSDSSDSASGNTHTHAHAHLYRPTLNTDQHVFCAAPHCGCLQPYSLGYDEQGFFLLPPECLSFTVHAEVRQGGGEIPRSPLGSLRQLSEEEA